MNPYSYVLSDLNLTIHAQSEWSWVWLYLSTMALIWDDDSTHANPYREVISRLPAEGYAIERIRQLLNAGRVKYDTIGR